MSNRDPFPSPRCENDFTLGGFSAQQKGTSSKPTHIAQTEQPWSRLHDSATFASSCRSVLHFEPQPQGNDSLDFQLRSVYDHSRDSFWRKNQILYQKETFSEEQRKEENLKQELLEKERENTTRRWTDPQRRSI